MVCGACLLAPIALFGIGTGVSTLYFSVITGLIITIISCLIYLYMLQRKNKTKNKNCTFCI